MVVLGNIVIKGDFERDHRDKLFGTEFGGILGYLEPFWRVLSPWLRPYRATSAHTFSKLLYCFFEQGHRDHKGVWGAAR